MRRRLFSLSSGLAILALLAACAAAPLDADRHPGAKRINTYGCPCR